MNIKSYFTSHAFSIDNGALLTSCYIEPEGIQAFETDSYGNEFEFFFTNEALESAEIFANHAMIRDNVSGEMVRVEFYSVEPVELS